MFKFFSIVALVGFLAACSTVTGSGGAPDTATLGALGSPAQSAMGPKGNGP